MIAAGVPPRRCLSCGTTWATCTDRREFRSAACCAGCDHDDPLQSCPCGANEFACARQASNGGRLCCFACSHVRTTTVKEEVE